MVQASFEEIEVADVYGEVIQGSYVGNDIRFVGRKALIRPVRFRMDRVGVQFNERVDGFGFGWHEFHKADFVPDKRETVFERGFPNPDLTSETRS